MKPAANLSLPAGRQPLRLLAAIVVGAIALTTAIVMGTVRAGWAPMPALFDAPAATAPRGVAYTFADTGVVKIDATSGRILARWPLPTGFPHPAFAVAPDAGSVYVLNMDLDGPHLHILDGSTLAPQLRVPAPDYARAIGWSPLVVMDDNRTVVTMHWSEQNDWWLSYFDRQASAFTAARTPLPLCGEADLIPLGAAQLAVRCTDTNDVRLVDVGAQRVVATTPLGGSRAFNRPGWGVGTTRLPGTATLAVVLDDARLLHVDPIQQTVTQIAELAPGSSQVVARGGVAFSPNGRAVVAIAANAADRAEAKASTLLAIDVTTGQILNRVAQASRFDVDLSPDGRRAFVVDGERRVVVDLTTGRTQPFTAGHPVEFR